MKDDNFRINNKNIEELLNKEKGKILEKLYEEEQKRDSKSISISYALDYLEGKY